MFSKLMNIFKKGTLTGDRNAEKPSLETPERASHIKEENVDHLKHHEHSPEKKNINERISKNGIRIFDKDQDINALFVIDDEEEKEQEIPESPHGTSIKKTEKHPLIKKNRHGIPIIEGDMGFSDQFIEPEDESSISGNKTSETGNQGTTRKSSVFTDKHGIPFLSHDKPLSFSKGDSDESFKDLLYESLGQKSRKAMMGEKGTAVTRRKPLTLKQKLKRYPESQGQLDLHGYTAMKADLKADSFLKNAYHTDTHTVTIIVGKGLHSEEGAVIPDVVEDRLKVMKKQAIVLDYEWENKIKSKSGAVIVYLNNLSFD